jgi:hypothetical protein
MGKWFAGLFCFLLLVLIALIVVLFNLGPVVKIAVNHYGPGIMKTNVHLGKADVSVFKAQACLEDLALGNPAGFSAPNAMTIGSIIVDVDKSTLTKNTVVINRVEVLQPEITYEIKRISDNFRTIINNMKKTESPGKKGGENKAEKKNGKKVIIRDLILKDIKIRTSADIVGGDIATTTISEIHLRNIGEKQNGVEIAQALLTVLNELYRQIISVDNLDMLKKKFDGIGNQLKGVKDEMKSIGGQLKGLFD